jgi:uncharacterized protein DUF6544
VLTLLALAAIAWFTVVQLKKRRVREEAAVDAAWAALASRAGQGAFDPAMVDGLPEPARRWLLHAIAPGTPLAAAVELEMKGTIRMTPYGWPYHLTARELLSPPEGLVWRARMGEGKVWLYGADRCGGADAETRFRVWDLVPGVLHHGPDVARSGAGRLALESIWLPPAFLPQRGARWEPVDGETARVTLPLAPEPVTLTVRVGEDGALRQVTLLRWGDKNRERRFLAMPCTAEIHEERTFGGYTIPARLGVVWGPPGTDSELEFYRPEIVDARFR